MIEAEHTVLLYEYVPDVADRRGPHREAHLAWLRQWQADGRLVAAGALGDPPSGALLVLSASADPEELVSGDPYVAAGLVSSWSAAPWNVPVR